MRISAGFLLGLAMMLLLMPLQWLVACIAAAAFHEVCHCVAIRFLSGKATKVKLLSYAAQLPLPVMGTGREAICALAGPVGGLLLLFFAKWMPRLSVCAAVQSIYNLLPIYPLDGGRALRCGLSLLLPPKPAKRIAYGMEAVCIIGLLAFAVYACIWLKMGLFPLLIALLLLIRIK